MVVWIPVFARTESGEWIIATRDIPGLGFFDGDCGAGALVGLAFDFEGAAVGLYD
jgi:hypothetical protein